MMKTFVQAGASLTLLATGACALAQTTSPFTPPEQDMGKYVTNSGAGLDTGCTYRGSGPLVVRFKVPAPVNETQLDGQGKLKDPGKLVADKVVGARAKISFPVYDIDDKAVTDGTYAPEIDNLSWNGTFIKTLSGFNNQWVNDSFEVDIGEVKFASPSNPGVVNEFQVDIDTGNVGNGEYWCMAIDWVGIEFDAAYPFALIHGIAAKDNTWDAAEAPGVLDTMDKSGALYKRFFTGNRNGAVMTNAADLKGQITGYLDQVKAKKVNLIVHSKGGLDSQAMAVLSPPEFEVLSLGTLSTPHRGSVVADLTLLQRALASIYEGNGQDPNGYARRFVDSTTAGIASGFGAGPQPPGLNDLTTQSANQAISAGLRGNVGNTFTIGADAGPNCSREPSNGEIDPMNPISGVPIFGNYTYNALRLAYMTICNFSSAVQLSFEVLPNFDPSVPPITVLTYQTVLNASASPNDVVVALPSANPGWGTPLGNQNSINHSTVKNGGNVRKILDETIKLR
ncbi:esterase/lipase family protein [Paucibacter sp. KCTC 42545]|uniref:esterase/lipase family protein n=1 Tax=Paucibacter sp. KCTC 42545 TaxID=1768242 RepID=UPI000733BFAA|nr:hypothetical protein [Paucibacter sp. KCTC 42545]ALT76273.1 hypothetical protein AT984_02675 [Paucibacter sp. KCTC 42545]